MNKKYFSILITTKDRKDDLELTLKKIEFLLSNPLIKLVIFDDGSNDATFDFVKTNYPKATVYRNTFSKGYIYCRNKMLNETNADFAISLDDDAHFLVENPLEIITDYFEKNSNCGLIAARIFWSKLSFENSNNNEIPQQVKSYVGCGHVWRMKAWRDIPNYPEWFEFYGEENFASFQLFKKKWKVDYLPALFVQHRVDLKERAKSKIVFAFRYRRAIRADWYNYFLFFPLLKIPRKITYSIWMQCKTKIFKGDLRVIQPLLLAFFDLIMAFPKLIKHRNALTSKEYQTYVQLNEAKIYWKP